MERYTIKLICLLAGLLAGASMGVYIHELGHQMACTYLGYESGGITINMLKSTHMCIFNEAVSDTNKFTILASGGGLASIIFGIGLLIFQLSIHIRKRLGNFLFPFILAGFIPQVINVIMEAGFNALYNDQTRALGVACGLFLVICIWYKYHLPKSTLDNR